MGRTVSIVMVMTLTLIVVPLAVLAGNPEPVNRLHPDSEAAFDYLRGLEGRWVVRGGDEGPLGWEFAVTSRGSVVIERLKVGTPTEMVTVYHLDNGSLVAAHFCQLGNQPHLRAVTSEAEGDLHFVCDGDVASTESHSELHMHGVHFQKKGDGLLIWMDMLENGEIAFRTSYELARAD
jgi:hypothetical protein